MRDTIYCVEGVNVDGCGGSGYAYVRFPKILTYNEKDRFAAILKSIKQKDGWQDTEDMVGQALKQFQDETVIVGELCSSPLSGVIEF